MAERKAVTERYWRATKKQKGRILDEFTKLMGYNRSSAKRVQKLLLDKP